MAAVLLFVVIVDWLIQMLAYYVCILKQMCIGLVLHPFVLCLFAQHPFPICTISLIYALYFQFSAL